MKLLDESIWREFFRFDLTGREFNALEKSEKLKYFNTLKFSVKESISKISTFRALDSQELRKVFKQIDRRVQTILFD